MSQPIAVGWYDQNLYHCCFIILLGSCNEKRRIRITELEMPMHTQTAAQAETRHKENMQTHHIKYLEQLEVKPMAFLL